MTLDLKNQIIHSVDQYLHDAIVVHLYILKYTCTSCINFCTLRVRCLGQKENNCPSRWPR